MSKKKGRKEWSEVLKIEDSTRIMKIEQKSKCYYIGKFCSRAMSQIIKRNSQRNAMQWEARD